MGDLIALSGRFEERSALRPTSTRPRFYFDLGCPFSYFAAERVERLLGELDWIPASSTAFPASSAPEAEERASALRLPLVWPERFGEPVHGAMRAAAYASEGGASARFALAAFRLAFCGGYDLDVAAVLGELARATGIPRAGCLQASADAGRDEVLLTTARALRRRGVQRLPAFGLAGRLLAGESALGAVAALQREVRGPSPVAYPA
jgi:2-hydroxychromene-2-carboxylate isomerase